MFSGQSNTPFSSGGFGQNTAPFGSPAPAPGSLFSSPTPAFGAQTPAPTFGAPSTGFGGTQPSGFQQQTGGGLFSSTTSSGFGSTQPSGFQQQTGGSLFSSTTTGTTFGAPSSSFGQTQTGGIFGSSGTQAPTSSMSSPFGAPVPSSFPTAPAPAAFGGTSAFGAQPAPAPSLFGAPASSATPFGSQPSTTTGFGAAGSLFPTAGATTTPAIPFGAAPSPSAPNIFGSPVGQTAAAGTRGIPYQVTSRQDGTSSINLQSISAMPQYEGKCHEELRYEDYSQGNRGTPAAPTTTTTTAGFGSTFGSPAAAPTPGLFGAPAPSTSTGFGGSSTAASTSSLFGAPAPSTSTFGGFGGTSAQTPSPGLFGAPAPSTSSPFAAPSSFGSTAAATSGFSGFGSTQQAPAPGGLFGGTQAPAPSGGLWGQQPAGAPSSFAGLTPFPAPTTGGLFSQPSPGPSGGLFGGTQAAAPSGGFWGQQPAGAPSSFSGLTPSPAPTTGGLFSQPSPVPAWGASPAPWGAQQVPAPAAPTTPQALFPQNAQIIPAAANEILEQQLRAMENQKKELEKTEVWRGSTPRSVATTPTSLPDTEPLYRSDRSFGLAMTPRSAVKIRPRGFPKTEPVKQTAPSVTFPRRDTSDLMSPEAYVRSTRLNLVIREGSLKKPSRIGKLRLEASSPEEPLPRESITQPPPAEEPSPLTTAAATTSPAAKAPTQATPVTTATSPEEDRPPASEAYDYYQEVVGGGKARPPDTPAVGGSPAAKSSVVPTLAKIGYEVSPSLEQLASMSEADLATVRGFTVSRPGYGMVQWEGAVDVREADLDRIVTIEKMDVSVYSADEEEGTKPMEGSKLNRPAFITFYNVYPQKDGASASEEEKEKFARKVQRSTEKTGAEFISYDRERGVWKIRVRHFSRYGLIDEEDSHGPEDVVEEVQAESTKPTHATPRLQFKPLASRKTAPYKPTRIAFQDMESLEAMEEDDVMVVSEPEVTEEDILEQVRLEAEDAAKAIFESTREPTAETKRKIGAITFEEEGESEDESQPDVLAVDLSDAEVAEASAATSFSASLRQRSNITTSDVDSGLYMGRSFRACWLPDGSVLKLNAGPELVKSRPLLWESSSEKAAARLLETQRIHSFRSAATSDDECPLFSLPSKEDNLAGLLPHDAVCDALKSFASAGPSQEEATASFKLLLDFFDSESDSGRHLFAIYKLLVDLCSSDVEKEIKEAKLRGDSMAAVFAALSGGDVERASECAAEAGLTSLAAALASSAEGTKDVFQHIIDLANNHEVSNVATPEAKRILSAVGGKVSFEDQRYQRGSSTLDWRRRLVLRILQQSEKNLLETLRAYENDIGKGEVPYPLPRYVTDESLEVRSLFYRLLQFVADPKIVTVLEVVDPRGSSAFVHDCSLSFHLASAMVAWSSSESLTLSPYEAECVMDGYEAQLTSQGCWERAVFVALSLCGHVEPSAEVKRWKRARAKNLVLRHYNEDDPQSLLRRDFLIRKLGVPSAWLNEALAYRAIVRGDSREFVANALYFDVASAVTVFEQSLLPGLTFMRKEEAVSVLSVIDVAPGSFGIESPGLAMRAFFDLEFQIMELAGRGAADVDAEEIEDLDQGLERCKSVFLAIDSWKPSAKISPSLFAAKKRSRVDLFATVSEALDRLDYLKTQLQSFRCDEMMID